MIDLRAIAQRFGGRISGNECLIPTPGHSSRDRGTALRFAPGAPDDLLVTCFNGSRTDAIAVKDMLRAEGFLPAYEGKRRELTQAERLAINRAFAEREREKALAHASAAEAARARLARSAPADPSHPYLARKRIPPERLWQIDDRLLVPMTDGSGKVWNVQTIGPDGFKSFAKSARVNGLFWFAGEPSDRLVIGEGVATVAAVRRATGMPVIAAMTAGNLPTVASIVRARWPEIQIIIAADDDAAGMKAARSAAGQTCALLAVPEIRS